MVRYSINLNNQDEELLNEYMKEHKIKFKSTAIKKCIEDAIIKNDFKIILNDIAEDVKYLHNRRGLVIMKKEDDCEMAGRCLA